MDRERWLDAGPGQAWGHADLRFARAPSGRTHLAAARVRHPYHLCRALHLDDGTRDLCSTILQGTSGGLFEHDDLALSFSAGPGARAHACTAASTIVHAMTGGRAAQRVVLRADAGALLEWLPDPCILFPGSRLHAALEIHAHATATVLAADAFLAHDPAGHGRPFAALRTESVLRDATDGRLLALERNRVDGADWLAGRPAVNAGLPVHGTLWIARRGTPEHPLDVLQARLRDALAAVRADGAGTVARAGVTTLPDGAGLACRVLAADAPALRAAMHAAWRATRLFATGAEPTRWRR